MSAPVFYELPPIKEEVENEASGAVSQQQFGQLTEHHDRKRPRNEYAACPPQLEAADLELDGIDFDALFNDPDVELMPPMKKFSSEEPKKDPLTLSEPPLESPTRHGHFLNTDGLKHEPQQQQEEEGQQQEQQQQQQEQQQQQQQQQGWYPSQDMSREQKLQYFMHEQAVAYQSFTTSLQNFATSYYPVDHQHHQEEQQQQQQQPLPVAHDKESVSSSSLSLREQEEGITKEHQVYYRRAWTSEEDKLLIEYVKENGPKAWSVIAAIIKTKNSNQCSQRWNKALDPSIKKGAWSAEEDALLCRLVEQKGTRWKLISNDIEGRTGKQCRDRYTARLSKTHVFS